MDEWVRERLRTHLRTCRTVDAAYCRTLADALGQAQPAPTYAEVAREVEAHRDRDRLFLRALRIDPEDV